MSGSGGGSTGICTAPAWDPTKAYMGGDKVSVNHKEYVARYFTLGENPETHHEPSPVSMTGEPWTFPTDC
jgi:chitodextrinase